MKIKPTRCVLLETFSIGLIAISVAATSVRAAPPTVSTADRDAALKQQVAELQGKIKQLESQLPAKAASPVPSPAMPPMNQTPAASPISGMIPGASGAMGMGDMKMGEMPKNPPGTAPMPGGGMGDMMTGMMGMMNKMMGMNAMPSASPGMASVPQSALPGFPGVSHLYHIGSTGFFLDHAAHIGLTSDQQAVLTKLKDQALAAKTGVDRQIEEAEVEMATLTGADQPDSAKIEAKVSEIGKFRSSERLAFIRAVGDAAKMLTDDQRKILTGAMQAAAPAPSATMAPMQDM